MRPDELYDVFAGLVLKQRAEALLNELRELKRRPHENSIHDTRVQSRRMRAALEVFQDLVSPQLWEPLYDSVRRITKDLGEVRETEVSLFVIKDLTAGGDLAENLCGEYFEEQLKGKLQKLQRRLRKNLRRIDIRNLRSHIKSLLAGLGTADELEAAKGSVITIQSGRSSGGRLQARSTSRQPTLFSLRGETIERARLVLNELAAPLIAFRARRDFPRATDARLHRLRIGAKKLRYAMEIFGSVWPGGLKEQIELSRALQETSGQNQDWAVMCRRLKKETRRLTRQETPRLAFQMERILIHAADRKAALREAILPALTKLQASLRERLQNPPLEGDTKSPMKLTAEG